jgi:hypothetical protein
MNLSGLLNRLRPCARLLLAAACTSAGPTAAAWAQATAPQLPAIEQGTATVTSRLVGSQLELRDAATDEVILALTNVPITVNWPAGVTTNISLQRQPHGADVSVTVRNVSASPKSMGKLMFGILNMGQQIEYMDSNLNSRMVEGAANDFVGQAWLYPLHLYSPAMVIRNEQRAVGLSVQYPIMDYKHDVRVSINSPGSWMAQGEAGRGWLVAFEFDNAPNQSSWTRMNFPGQLQAGEERTYVVSLRVSDRPNEWVRTLLPYRDYFRATYGGVQYRRETAPVRGVGLADTSLISSSNPRGFTPSLRPDHNGFGPFVRYFDSQGWDEMMIWTPSGLYRENRDLNWPFQMVSPLTETPQLATAFSVTDGFPWLASRRKVGFWWGRSLDVSFAWDSPQFEHFDPDNQLHVSVANRELDEAARAGATVIGLDTFTPLQVPIWKLLPWLDQMRTRQPQVKFVTEPAQCDLLHLHAPTWLDGWVDIEGTTQNREDLFQIHEPNVLSDFIAPGHESWAAVAYRPPYVRSFGQPTPQQILADIQRLAGFGYRPVIATAIAQPDDVASAATWETSLPADIRDSDPFIQNLRAGRLPNENAPAPSTPPNGNDTTPPAQDSSSNQPPTENPSTGNPPGSGQGNPSQPAENPSSSTPPANNLPGVNAPANNPVNTPATSNPPTNGNSAPSVPPAEAPSNPVTPIVAPISQTPAPSQPTANNSPARRNTVVPQRGIRVTRRPPVVRNNTVANNNNNNANSGNGGSSNAAPRVNVPRSNTTGVTRASAVRRPPGAMTVQRNQAIPPQQQTTANPQ